MGSIAVLGQKVRRQIAKEHKYVPGRKRADRTVGTYDRRGFCKECGNPKAYHFDN